MPDLTSCTRPTGLAGIRWVYPGFESLGGSCEAKKYRKTTVSQDCAYGDATIRYRYWKSTSEALKHYTTKYADCPRRTLLAGGEAMGTIWRYRTPLEADGFYKLSGFLEDHFSFSVESPNADDIDQLLPKLAIRPPANFRGVPSQGDADPVVTVSWS